MKIDFHMHAKLSKKVEFSIERLLNTIQEARKEGVTASALAVHFNTNRFGDVYKALDQHYEYVNNYYDIDGFRLFPSMEVDIEGGGHILTIGDREAVKNVREMLNEHVEQNNYIPIQKLLGICKPYEFLKIAAHPFRESNCLKRFTKDIFTQFDALELNAKDLHYGGEEMHDRVHALAQEMELPVVGGSDTHYYLQAGSIMNVFEEECNTIQQLKDCIKNNKYRIFVSPNIDIKVSTAEIEKKRVLVEESQRTSE